MLLVLAEGIAPKPYIVCVLFSHMHNAQIYVYVCIAGRSTGQANTRTANWWDIFVIQHRYEACGSTECLLLVFWEPGANVVVSIVDTVCTLSWVYTLLS